MDLLHTRYANPYTYLDDLIDNSKFNEFVEYIIKTDAEEKDDQKLWDLYLHSLYVNEAQSFDDWKQKITTSSGSGTPREQSAQMTEDKKQAIIQRSQDILNSFNPEQEQQHE